MKAGIYRISQEAAWQMARERVDIGQVVLALRYGQALRQPAGEMHYRLAGLWVETRGRCIVAVGRVNTKPSTE